MGDRSLEERVAELERRVGRLLDRQADRDAAEERMADAFSQDAEERSRVDRRQRAES